MRAHTHVYRWSGMGDFVRVSYKPNFKLGFQVYMRHVSSLICEYVCALSLF